MRRKLAIAFGLCALVGAAAAYAATAPPSTSTNLAVARFGSIDLHEHSIPASVWQLDLRTRGDSDGYIVDNKIPVGSATGWHTHPGPSLIFVVAGSITNYEGGVCEGTTYEAGSGFVDEGDGDVHQLVNEGDVPAETIAVQILPKGTPRKTPAPAPATDCAS